MCLERGRTIGIGWLDACLPTEVSDILDARARSDGWQIKTVWRPAPRRASHFASARASSFFLPLSFPCHDSCRSRDFLLSAVSCAVFSGTRRKRTRALGSPRQWDPSDRAMNQWRHRSGMQLSRPLERSCHRFKWLNCAASAKFFEWKFSFTNVFGSRDVLFQFSDGNVIFTSSRRIAKKFLDLDSFDRYLIYLRIRVWGIVNY